MNDAVAAPADDFSQIRKNSWDIQLGLYVCFTTELWERFSFYGMKYLLLLYLTKYHLFSDGDGLDVLGSYAGLVYALAVDRRHDRRSLSRHEEVGIVWRHPAVAWSYV